MKKQARISISYRRDWKIIKDIPTKYTKLVLYMIAVVIIYRFGMSWRKIVHTDNLDKSLILYLLPDDAILFGSTQDCRIF